MLVLSVVLTSVLVGSALSNESFFGRCPSVPAMEGFDMNQFEGLWYMAENFNKDYKCVTWNIRKGDEPGVWKLRESMESGVFNAVGLDHANYNEATVTMPDPEQPAKLRIKWPMSIAGDAAFTVHSTDYDRVAGVFECQNVGIFHRQNGVVLSRTPILKTELKQMARIHTEDINVAYFQNVLQGNCKYRFEAQDDVEDISDIFLADIDGIPHPGRTPGREPAGDTP